MRGEVLKEIECCRIQPLQIVEKQRERVLLPREDSEKTPKDHLEAVLRVLRWQIQDRRLWSNYKLEFGNEIHDELAVLTERLAQSTPPLAELFVASPQKRANKALKCLGESAVWDVALVLIKLAGCEQTSWRDKHLV